MAIQGLSELEYFEERFPWTVLSIFNAYRCFLSLALMLLYFAQISNFPVGLTLPQLYEFVSVCYVIFAFVVLWPSQRRMVPFNPLVYTLIVVDIIALSLMMRASLPMTNFFTILTSVAVAAGSMMTAGRISLFFASVATIALLFIYGVLGIEHRLDLHGFENAGLLGATYFVIAILGYGLSKRIRTSESLARQRKVELAKLEKLNEYIIQRMQSGIVVVDKYKNVRFVNKAAEGLLVSQQNQSIKVLEDLPNILVEKFTNAKELTMDSVTQINLEGRNLLLQFVPVGEQYMEDDLVLIVLEDSNLIAQQAQSLKLASLGRLTASIAHEVRNPLSAISHAAELMQESENLSQENTRLTEIIRKQSSRMNRIIENVLQLSRQKKATPVKISLKEWLENFVAELTYSGTEEPEVNLTVVPADLVMYFDEEQLKQVLNNLCENALFFSHENKGKPIIKITAKKNNISQGPCIEVMDYGRGIHKKLYPFIFEPFFTTKNKGTGLGLFIARELCEANNAKLTHEPCNETGGCCFRITSFSFIGYV